MTTFNKWKTQCNEDQVNISQQLGDRIWDEFSYPENDVHLFQKIAIAAYGRPKKESDDLGLSEEQKALVNEIKNKVISHNKNKKKIRIAVMFVFVYIDNKTQSVAPLIRAMSYGEQQNDVPKNTFIDHLGRVYTSWENYKLDNTWNQSWLCVPEHGCYSPQLKVVFLDQSSRGKVLEVIDQVSTGLNVGSTLGLIAGGAMLFFPLTMPIAGAVMVGSAIVGAPSAVYGVGRSVEGLVDRGTHEQSISLADPEARRHWLTTATSIISVATLGAGQVIASSAKAGNLVSRTSRIMYTALNITNISASGLGVINSAIDLTSKKNVTPLDIFQLTTSIMFFTHSVVSFKTAGSLIKRIQTEELKAIRKTLSPADQAKHEALIQSSQEVLKDGKVVKRVMHGQAKLIKGLKKIDNLPEFYSHFEIRTDGQFTINGDLTIHPRAFLQISESDKKTLLQASRKLQNNEIDFAQFNKETAAIQKEHRLRFESQRVEAANYLKKIYKVADLKDIKIGGKPVGHLSPEQIDRLEGVAKQSFKGGDEQLMNVVDKFTEQQGVTNLTEYCAASEYVLREVDARVNEQRAMNPNPERPPGIKAKDHYRTQVFNDLLKDGGMDSTNASFRKLQETYASTDTGNPRFPNNMAAANHYDKHPFFPKVDPVNNLSPEQYFNIATEMAGGPITDVKWTQNGEALMCSFDSDKYGAMAIRYDNLANKTSVIATLMSTFKNSPSAAVIKLINVK